MIAAAFDEAVGNLKNPVGNLQVNDGPQTALAEGSQVCQ